MTEQEELIIKEAELRIFSLTSDCIVLKKENDKLRELVRDIYQQFDSSIDWTVIERRMHELGIEVDE